MSAPVPRRTRFLHALAWGYPIVLATLAILFRTVGERFWLFVPMLYLPGILWAAPLPIFLFLLRRTRPRKILLSQALAAILLLFPILGFHLSLHRHPHDPDAIRIMTFNVWYLRRGEATILDEVRGDAPDVIVVQAAPGRRTPHAELLEYFHTGWYLDAWGDFFIASRFPIADSYHPPALAGDHPSAFARYTLTTPRGPLDLYTTHPFSPRDGMEDLRSGSLDDGTRRTFERNAELRRQQVAALAEHASHAQNPVVIAGDTNLPTGSYFLRHYLGNFRDAFDEAGSGFGYTFPANRWPWMRIDRVLVGEGVEVKRVEVGGKRASDHCPLIAEIVLAR
jgi:endonuclease/exonuclease/phosphatase (EEP) superfamily protein YafD